MRRAIEALKNKTVVLTTVQKTIVEGQRAVGKGHQARAHGGPVQGGQSYLVGERGPELIVPAKNGYVLTAAETKAALAGGGNTYNNYFGETDPVRIVSLLRRTEALYA